MEIISTDQVVTVPVKYIYYDIVGFTKNRSVEAQSDLIGYINEITKAVLAKFDVPVDKRILLPTGDGICIALLDISSPYDLHISIALELLQLVANHNESMEDEARRFEIRIGVNELTDNIVIDINGKRNVAGAGIAMAQRVMDKADGGQILVGESVYRTLQVRERYMEKAFARYSAVGKHGAAFSLYQLVLPGLLGLNLEIPAALFVPKPSKPEPARFTRLAAYYVAHAAKNREFLVSCAREPFSPYVGLVLLAMLAKDSVEVSEAKPYEEVSSRTWGAGEASFEQQYRYYAKVDHWLLVDLGDFIGKEWLSAYASHFETREGGYLSNFTIIRKSAVRKLSEDWPDIFWEFDLQQDLEP